MIINKIVVVVVDERNKKLKQNEIMIVDIKCVKIKKQQRMWECVCV